MFSWASSALMWHTALHWGHFFLDLKSNSNNHMNFHCHTTPAMRSIQDNASVKCRSVYLRRDFTRHVRQKEWPQEIDRGSHIRLRQRGHSKTLSTNSRLVLSELSSEFVSGVGELSSLELCWSTTVDILFEIRKMLVLECINACWPQKQKFVVCKIKCNPVASRVEIKTWSKVCSFAIVLREHQKIDSRIKTVYMAANYVFDERRVHFSEAALCSLQLPHLSSDCSKNHGSCATFEICWVTLESNPRVQALWVFFSGN